MRLVLVVVGLLACIQGATAKCPALPNGVCNANCPCQFQFACVKTAATGVDNGICQQCTADGLVNCISGQKCVNGLCTWVVCGTPPSHVGDACDDVCKCPSNLICATSTNPSTGKVESHCAECSANSLNNCLSGQVCSDGRCIWQSCGNSPKLAGQPCNSLCPCPKGLFCTAQDLCIECGRGHPCPVKSTPLAPNRGICFHGRCFYHLG